MKVKWFISLFNSPFLFISLNNFQIKNLGYDWLMNGLTRIRFGRDKKLTNFLTSENNIYNSPGLLQFIKTMLPRSKII